jgi:hypothetical protein
VGGFAGVSPGDGFGLVGPSCCRAYARIALGGTPRIAINTPITTARTPIFRRIVSSRFLARVAAGVLPAGVFPG